MNSLAVFVSLLVLVATGAPQVAAIAAADSDCEGPAVPQVQVETTCAQVSGVMERGECFGGTVAGEPLPAMNKCVFEVRAQGADTGVGVVAGRLTVGPQSKTDSDSLGVVIEDAYTDFIDVECDQTKDFTVSISMTATDSLGVRAYVEGEVTVVLNAKPCPTCPDSPIALDDDIEGLLQTLCGGGAPELLAPGPLP